MIFFLIAGTAMGQNIDELNKKQAQIKKEIALLSRLINETSSSILSQQDRYTLLLKRRDARKELLEAIASEIQQIDEQIKAKKARIEQLEEKISRIEEEYAQLARQVYLWEKTSSPYIYLLSSQSLNQAFRRYFYIKQFEESRKEKKAELKKLTEEQEAEKKALEAGKAEKVRVSEQKKAENKELQADINELEGLLRKLKDKQETLKANLAQQQAAMEELEATIRKLIERERKKSEESREDIADAPEMKALASEFKANKGKLPWPVDKGIIGRKFGKQHHPTIHSLLINNNGIDITTVKGAQVKAIFEGKVISVVYVPGYQKMVIVKHGGFYTVYSRLAEVYVDKGMHIPTGASIGTAFYDDKTGKSQVHLEIWHGKSKLNPEKWLLSR